MFVALAHVMRSLVKSTADSADHSAWTCLERVGIWWAAKVGASCLGAHRGVHVFGGGLSQAAVALPWVVVTPRGL